MAAVSSKSASSLFPTLPATPHGNGNGHGNGATASARARRLKGLSKQAAELNGLLETVQAIKRGNFAARFRTGSNSLVARIGRTINDIIEMNQELANELIRVSQIVGQEGRMTERVSIRFAKGAWATSVNSVNSLIGDLARPTNEVARVITSVAKGDLTRHIAVEAQGEVAALKDNINLMIATLKETTQENKEQDWLKTHIAKFTEMMQGQRSIVSVAQLIMSELTPLVGAYQGTFFIMEEEPDPVLKLVASYAFPETENGRHFAN